MTKVTQTTKEFNSVWDAISDTPAESENMKVRAALMNDICEYIKRHKYTQVQAAKVCQITQPRASDLINGRISKFSLDALVNIAAAANLHVNITVQEEEFA